MLKKYFLLLTTLAVNIPAVPAIAQDKPAAPAATAKSTPPEIKERLDRNIPRLKNKAQRESALNELHQELMKAANSEQKYPQGEERKQLSRELVNLYRQTKDKDFSHPSIRRRLIYDIVRYGDNETAKPFAINLLENGTAEERTEVLRVVGAPGGVGGAEIYDKVADLANRGVIPKDGRASVLARIDKQRALPEILNDIESAQDKLQFISSARTLQNLYRQPENFKRVLPRLKALGLDKRGSFRGGNGLFWIDAALLTNYVESAKGQELVLALEIINADSTLCAPGAVPTLIKKLSEADPRTRGLAATALGKAAEDTRSDMASIKAALNTALQKESVAKTAESIKAALHYIDVFEKAWKRETERARP